VRIEKADLMDVFVLIPQPFRDDRRGEAKLVRCANGAVHDVLVDIRRDSPTFGK
jgi:dTDP-4-dehydrorhamnose 3,5-epimerase-like enzyme